MLDYTYGTNSILGYREKYSYSQFQGECFLDAFFCSRQDFLEYLSANFSGNAAANEKTISELGTDDGYIVACRYLHNLLYDKNANAVLEFEFHLLVKRFEATRKIFDKFDRLGFKAVKDSTYEDLDNYILFSACCGKAYTETKHLSFLNAMLKCNDVLSSERANLSNCNIALLQSVLNDERDFVLKLLEK